MLVLLAIVMLGLRCAAPGAAAPPAQATLPPPGVTLTPHPIYIPTHGPPTPKITPHPTPVFDSWLFLPLITRGIETPVQRPPLPTPEPVQ